MDAYHALSGVCIEVAGWRTPPRSDVQEESEAADFGGTIEIDQSGYRIGISAKNGRHYLLHLLRVLVDTLDGIEWVPTSTGENDKGTVIEEGERSVFVVLDSDWLHDQSIFGYYNCVSHDKKLCGRCVPSSREGNRSSNSR